jgi:hypothetical protein
MVPFKDIPATEEWLRLVSLSLHSSYAFSERPKGFAQGTGKVALIFRFTPAVLGDVVNPARGFEAPLFLTHLNQYLKHVWSFIGWTIGVH